MASSKAKKPVKKTVASKKTSTGKSKAKTSELKSFRLAKESNFFRFKISIQTVYWTILVVVIIVLQLLIINAQFEVANTNDELTRQLESRN